MTEAWALWLLLAAGIAVTYLWRGLGVALAARIDPAGSTFHWITCVSYAMLAGLVARMIVLPIGALEATPLIDRVAALALGFVAFYLCRRNYLPGVAVGFVCFLALTGARTAGWFGAG